MKYQPSYVFHNIINSVIFIYLLTLIVSVIAGGSIIRIYGYHCGVNIFDIVSVFTGSIAIGSPYCKCLNSLASACSIIVEKMWYHLFGLCFATCMKYTPMFLQNKNNGLGPELMKKHDEIFSTHVNHPSEQSKSV